MSFDVDTAKGRMIFTLLNLETVARHLRNALEKSNSDELTSFGDVSTVAESAGIGTNAVKITIRGDLQITLSGEDVGNFYKVQS